MMNKLICTIIIAGACCACAGGKDKQASEINASINQPLSSKNSEVFNESFEKMFSSYTNLKNAFVEYDTVAANAAAIQLAVAADSLKIQEIKGDSTGAIKETAASYSSSISSAAKNIPSEKELDGKKRQFQAISDALYDLMRTVKYDKQKVYRQHCPMAFNDQEEAYWISVSDEVVNPYLGNKHPKYKGTMLHCGDLADSLDFRK